MLGAYLEAGGTLAEFWDIETPRTVSIRVQAYRRRRGWAAWQTAALGRFTWKGIEGGVPPLWQMMGLPEPKRRAQGDGEILAAMQSWVAATNRGQKAN